MPLIGNLPRILACMLAAGSLSLASAAKASPEALLLVDAESGKVLHAENATYPWYPASVTKLMTAYVTLRAVKERRISLDSVFTVSAVAMAQAPSKMGFRVGTQVTVDNALKMLMVKSANDMAVVLAEGVSGSIDKFSDEMNKAARRLGMTQTSYVNPNGLPADGQITSARDLAILARALIHEFPEYDSYWHIPAIRFGKRVMRNYNTLIDRYPGADGMKTGFICASGFNLVATATRNGKRLIAVVLGAPSSSVRAVKAAQLLESGFSSNALSWLTPSLGQVDALPPINAAPPNLREEMCGKHRKRPAAEDMDDDEPAGVANSADPSSAHSFLLSSFKTTHKPSTLLGPLVSSAPPVVVFVGSNKHPRSGAKLAVNTPTAKQVAAHALPGQIAPRPEKASDAPAFAAVGASAPAVWSPFTPAALAQSAPAAAATPAAMVIPLPRSRPRIHAPLKPSVR